MIIWLNGHLTPDGKARIAPTDRGFLLGDGVFETLLIREGKPVFLSEHVTRLAHGAAVLGFDVPITQPALQTAISDLLAANHLASATRAALRITLTRGSGPRGLAPPDAPTPTMMITCFAAQNPAQAVTAITSTIRRNEFSPTSRLKALPYLDQVLAKREAAAGGADDALLLNTSGKVVCATSANLFLWDSNTLITPPLEDGCLDGITRRMLMHLANSAGIDCYEESITPSTLANVEGGFLTNALIGAQPLAAIDGRVLPEHALMKKLQEALQDAEKNSASA